MGVVAALLVQLGCRASPPAVAPAAAPRSEASAEGGAPSDGLRTFRLDTVDAPDTHPGFTPALVAMARPEGERDEVSFGWRAPCRVPVRHFNYRSDRGGSTMRMTIAFDEAGRGYRVRMLNLEFETVAGHPADDPEIRDAVQRLETAAASMMPYFRVSSDGRYLGLSDTDKIVEFVLEEVGPEASSQVGEVLRSPATRAQIEGKAGDYWKGWVEVWAGLTLRPGESLEQRRRLPFYGDAIDVDVVLTHLGTVEGHPQLRLYRSRQVLEGPEFERIMMQRLRDLAAQVGGPEPPEDAIESMRREATIHTAIDPERALPHRSRYTSVSSVGGKTRVEVTDWEFDWSAAEGCSD